MKPVHYLFPTATAILVGFAPELSHACPLCHTTTAEDVRQGILATAANLDVLLGLGLPFIVLSFIYTIININWNRDEHHS